MMEPEKDFSYCTEPSDEAELFKIFSILPHPPLFLSSSSSAILSQFTLVDSRQSTVNNFSRQRELKAKSSLVGNNFALTFRLFLLVEGKI
jgi:hypothetical protein